MVNTVDIMSYKQGDIVDIKISFEDFMNNKEVAYQKTLDYVFKHRCHYCGCIPKNDEWAGENPNVCIDCKTDLE